MRCWPSRSESHANLTTFKIVGVGVAVATVEDLIGVSEEVVGEEASTASSRKIRMMLGAVLKEG